MMTRWQRPITMLLSCLWLSMLSALLAACSGPTGRRPPPSLAAEMSLRTGQSLAAIGVKPAERNVSDVDHTALQDRRVAFGLNNLLAEAFL